MPDSDMAPESGKRLSRKLKVAFLKLKRSKKSEVAANDTDHKDGLFEPMTEARVVAPVADNFSDEEVSLNRVIFNASSRGNANLISKMLSEVDEDISRFAILNLQNSAGRTPLMIAALKGHDTVVQTLLEHGARAHLTGVENQTALDFAREAGQTQIVSLLEAQLDRPTVSNRESWEQERIKPVTNRPKAAEKSWSRVKAKSLAPAAAATLKPTPPYKSVVMVTQSTPVATKSAYSEPRILAQYPAVNERGAAGWRPGDQHSTSSMYPPRLQSAPTRSLASYPSMGSRW